MYLSTKTLQAYYRQKRNAILKHKERPEPIRNDRHFEIIRQGIKMSLIDIQRAVIEISQHGKQMDNLNREMETLSKNPREIQNLKNTAAGNSFDV